MMISDTQHESWDALQEKLSVCQQAVCAEIAKTGGEGATLFELVRTMRIPVNRISGRVRELADASIVYDSGRRRTNPESGKRGIVWVAREELPGL